MIKRVLGIVKEEGLKGEDSKNIKGAVPSVGNCNHEGKGVLNVNSKLRKRGPKPVDVKMAGFVAFNADYHVPRSHPPKNNWGRRAVEKSLGLQFWLILLFFHFGFVSVNLQLKQVRNMILVCMQ